MSRHARKNYARVDRLKEQVLQELSDLIHHSLKDPRISSVITVTDVIITRDYSRATVYYTVLDPLKQADVQAALTHSRGFLRSQLSQRIRLFKMPELIFVYDESVERGEYISRLIESVVQKNIE